MKSRVHPKYKTKYRVGNWPAYERGALVHEYELTRSLPTRRSSRTDAVRFWATKLGHPIQNVTRE